MAVGQACGLEITLPLQAAENLGNGTGAEFQSMAVQLFRYSKTEYGFNCGAVQDVEPSQSPIEILVFNHSSTVRLDLDCTWLPIGSSAFTSLIVVSEDCLSLTLSHAADRAGQFYNDRRKFKMSCRSAGLNARK